MMLSDPKSDVHPEHRSAIVTMVLDERYLRNWMGAPRSTWLPYADQHGFDILVITKHLDESLEIWKQKCLVLSQPWSTRYERIVWIDSDILIRAGAPNILDGVPLEKVGAVISGSQLSTSDRHIFLERTFNRQFLPRSTDPEEVERVFSASQRYLYHAEGIKTDLDRSIQAGVLVFSPAHHRSLLEESYQFSGRENILLYEQSILSLLIIQGGLLHELSTRFNWQLYLVCVVHEPSMFDRSKPTNWNIAINLILTQLQNSYFLHFTGMNWLLDEIKGIVIPVADKKL